MGNRGNHFLFVCLDDIDLLAKHVILMCILCSSFLHLGPNTVVVLKMITFLIDLVVVSHAAERYFVFVADLLRDLLTQHLNTLLQLAFLK